MTKKGKLYYSPFRDERTPSFGVNENKNVWYDYGEGTGGDVITLAIRLEHLPFGDAVRRLLHGDTGDASGIIREHTKKSEIHPRRDFVIKDIDNSALVVYARERGISEAILRRYCQQAEYTYTFNYRGEEMTGRASMIAFRTDSGGYELRDRRFKTGEGHKDIRVIAEDKDKNATYVIFEGFFNMLSYAEIMASKGMAMPNVIVLNSVSIWQRAVDYLRRHGITGRIMLCLDNDPAGDEATRRLRKALPSAIDARRLTLGEYNDLNDRLIGTKAQKSAADASQSSTGVVVHVDDKHAPTAPERASEKKDAIPIPSAIETAGTTSERLQIATAENIPDEHGIYMHVAEHERYTITAYHDRVEVWLTGRGWLSFNTVIPFDYPEQLANKIVTFSAEAISNEELTDKINEYIYTNSAVWTKARLTNSKVRYSMQV